jgi:hypothetical protein
MRKISFFLLASILFISCNNSSKNKDNLSTEVDTSVTGYDDINVESQYEKLKDSILKNQFRKRALDTTGISKSPVIVLNSRFVEKEYSNYKDIQLTYKNVSDKKIQGIRFEWFGENAFGEAAEMGRSLLLGEGGGFTDEILSPGRKSTGTWEIFSKDGKKIITARAYEVAFTDGTIWKLRKD